MAAKSFSMAPRNGLNNRSTYVATVATGDTFTAALERSPYAGAINFAGTWGGATLTATYSVDGTNFYGLADEDATAIAPTANAVFQHNKIATHIKITPSGGTDDAVVVTIVTER